MGRLIKKEAAFFDLDHGAKMHKHVQDSCSEISLVYLPGRSWQRLGYLCCSNNSPLSLMPPNVSLIGLLTSKLLRM